MNLNRVATHFNSTEFDVLDLATRAWSGSLSGRLASSDRFLSNFNRPTRKRMLYTDFSSDLSSVDVVRHKHTGEIYLVGVERKDSLKDTKTTQLAICHLVTPGDTSGLASVTRPTTLGTGDDLGVVTLQSEGQHYIDLELRTTSKEPGSKETEVGSYFCFSESQADIQDGDKLVLNGVPYIVDETSYDSGFKLLRVTQKDLHYVDMMFTFGEGRSYDRNAGAFVSAAKVRHVSGLVTKVHNSADGVDKTASDYTEVHIPKRLIGFEPEPNMSVTLLGKEYTVIFVDQSEYRNEWTLRLR